MRIPPPTVPLVLAAAAAALLPFAGAAESTSGWPEAPGDGLRASVLPSGETAADLSIAAGRDSDLFLAWTESSGNLLRVQRLTEDGLPGFGSNGVVARSGVDMEILPASTRRENDARGRFDLFPTSDGGVIVAWTERATLGRDLRVQRFDAAGSAVFGAGGLVALEGFQDGEEAAALAADGGDGAYACGIFGSDGIGLLRFQHVRSNGTLAHPLPGLAVDTAVEPKRGPSITRLGNGDAALCWFRDDGNGLRLQVVGTAGAKLAVGGVALAPSNGGFPTLRAAGSAIPGYLLIAHRLGTEVRLLLADAFGNVLRDEFAGQEALVASPDITAVNAVVNSLPEGIELKGIRADGAAARFVRLMDGTWTDKRTFYPPTPDGSGSRGALGGPGWVFDLGASSVGAASPRVLGYRSGSTDDELNPVLGPWLASAPGETPTARMEDAGPWVFTAWSVPRTGSPGSVLASRSGAFGGQDILDARGLVLRNLTVSRPPAPKTGSLNGKAPEVSLPATYDPVTKKPATPVTFTLRAGSEAGTLATLQLVTFKGTRSLAWKAVAANAGGTVTGQVRAGPGGRNLKIKVKGLPAGVGERVGWVRVDLDGRSLAGTVILTPNKSAKKAKFRENGGG